MKNENKSIPAEKKDADCEGNCLECPYLYQFDICGYETGTALNSKRLIRG